MRERERGGVTRGGIDGEGQTQLGHSIFRHGCTHMELDSPGTIWLINGFETFMHKDAWENIGVNYTSKHFSFHRML